MNVDSIAFQDHRQENIPTNTNESRNMMGLAEKASEISALFNADNFQLNQRYAEMLSSNNNCNDDDKLQSSVLDDYYTTRTDLQGQQSNPTNEHSIRSDVTFEQNGQQQQQQQQNVASLDNETPTLQHSKVPIYSKNYCQTSNNNQHTQEETMPTQEYFHRLNEYSATVTPIYRSKPTSSPINPSCAQSENASSSSLGNYELCGSYSAEYNPNVQQQQQQQLGNMQTESINSVPAHQWRQRREKLPINLTDPATFYTEWQINRPQVVNTAEIQKRKLLVFERKADEQLAPVNQPNTNSTADQLKIAKKKAKQEQQPQTPPQPRPCNYQEQQQQQQQQQLHQTPHLYRLHQMQQQQQQNYLHSPTPDSLSLPQQFAHSPVSLNSSTVSANPPPPQVLPYILPALPQQIQKQQQAPQPTNDNLNYNSSAMLPQQQQQLMLQMLQQQHLLQYYQSTVSTSFFDKWQKANEQKYQEALQENKARYKAVNTPRPVSRKRRSQYCSQPSGEDKENASVDSSELPVVIGEPAVEASTVADKCNDNLEPKLNSEEQKGQLQATIGQTGLWQNNYAMLQEWLQNQQPPPQPPQPQQQQQQDVGQKDSGVGQYGLVDYVPTI